MQMLLITHSVPPYLKKIIEFCVNDKFPESDHVPVSFSLSSNHMSELETRESIFRATRLTV